MFVKMLQLPNSKQLDRLNIQGATEQIKLIGVQGFSGEKCRLIVWSHYYKV